MRINDFGIVGRIATALEPICGYDSVLDPVVIEPGSKLLILGSSNYDLTALCCGNVVHYSADDFDKMELGDSSC